jgi:DNA ligase-associated metallophosphoesterase
MSASDWLETECAGERVCLSFERALWWPRWWTLWIADPHFGKGAVFRRAGIGLPAGTTQADLARLGALIESTGAERLVVLGDFYHAAPHGDEPWLASFARFRDRHRAVAIEVVPGNHDARARPPAAWNLAWHAGPLALGPFVGVHEPEARAEGYALGGHLHPAVVLEGGGDRLRLPVFWLRPEFTVLPAFGGLTGGLTVHPRRGDRLFAAGPDAVIPCHPSADQAGPGRK